MFDFLLLRRTPPVSILPLSRQSSGLLMDEDIGHLGETNYHQGWTECANALRERDEDNVEAMSDELDAFLAFSGIFSAVITLFVSQSATSLQPDNTQITVDILRAISQQIGNESAASAVSLTDTQPFQSSTIDIILNALLNAGLLCSLIASGMSLWVKEWLREYVLDEPSLPRSRARVRLFRYHGLRVWNVRGIVACISILLQLSVILCAAGIVMLAYKLNATLAWVLLGLNGAWWAVTWGSALCPTFSPHAPFKLPLSRVIFRVAYDLRRVLGSRLPRSFEKSRVGQFRTLEKRELDETARHQVRLELEALMFANREFWGNGERLRRINECFREVGDKGRALKHIEQILRAYYGMKTGGDTFEARGVHGLQTHNEDARQLMRIWCDIVVEHDGEKARRQERYQIFDEASRRAFESDPGREGPGIPEGAFRQDEQTGSESSLQVHRGR